MPPVQLHQLLRVYSGFSLALIQADWKHRNTGEKKPHVSQLRASFPTLQGQRNSRQESLPPARAARPHLQYLSGNRPGVHTLQGSQENTNRAGAAAAGAASIPAKSGGTTRVKVSEPAGLKLPEPAGLKRPQSRVKVREPPG